MYQLVNYYIYIQTNLINQYSLCQDIESALNIFNLIPENNRDIICIGSMMKAFINNNKFQETLKLFDIVNRKLIINQE